MVKTVVEAGTPAWWHRAAPGIDRARSDRAGAPSKLVRYAAAANLPAASLYPGAQAFQVDQGVVVTSNGTTWNPLTGSATYDPPNLAAGAQDAIQTLAVVGAALGDTVSATFSLDLQGLLVRAWVSAADTVKYVFANPTAGAVNLASGTVLVRVVK